MVAISSDLDLTRVKEFVDKLVQDNESFDNQSMRPETRPPVPLPEETRPPANLPEQQPDPRSPDVRVDAPRNLFGDTLDTLDLSPWPREDAVSLPYWKVIMESI